MNRISLALSIPALALLAAAAPPPRAPTAAAAAAEDRLIDQAAGLINAGKPADAVALLQQVVAAEERAHAGETRRVYCARTPAETLAYGVMAAKDHAGAIVLSQQWCTAIFLEGFAMIDLGKGEEAKAYLDRAVAMAPMNAHFLGELGEWYKNRKDLTTARDLFAKASDAAALSPPDSRSFDKRRGLRGLGYILIEQGRLEDAERLYNQCLAMDPNDDRAKAQLQYIAQQRAKTTRPVT